MASPHSEIFNIDSYLEENNPSDNYGGDIDLQAQFTTAKDTGDQCTIARVDFSELTDLTDPAQVTAAYTHMYVWSTDGLGRVGTRWEHLVDHFGIWTELGCTWSHAIYDTDAWDTAGAGTAAPYGAEVYADSLGYWDWDVIDIVKDAITNHAKVFEAVWRVSDAMEGLDPAFTYVYSRSGDAVKRPSLVIEYTPPGPPPGGSRHQGYVMGSRLGLPALPRGWLRQPGLRGLMVPAGC